MATSTTATGRYYLKSVHEEISLFDRKLAHLEKYETFTSDEERENAARKMTTKRNALVTIARRLIAEGVEFKASELPKSLRPEGSEAEFAAAELPKEKAAPPSDDSRTVAARRVSEGSPYAGTALDWQASVQQYLNKRNRK
jgi:hypothetical protein